MAIYKVQHNGKGKSHLLNANLEILCGSKGEFNFSDPRKLVILNGKFYEEIFDSRQELTQDLLEFVYCKKCLKHHDKQLKDHTK